jgi:hypothetical protein
MKRNDEVQEALIAYLKSKTAIAAEVTFVDEDGNSVIDIREDQFQGQSYSYPNIRLRLISNDPIDDNCQHSLATYSWMVFSETPDSLQADYIAGIINAQLHDRQFSSNSIAFTSRTTSLVPAVRIDQRTWRSEVIQNAVVS